MKMMIFFLFLVSSSLASTIVWLISVLIQKKISIIVISLLLALILQLILLFRYQFMFLERKNALIALKRSFTYFLRNKRHVFAVWLIIFAVSMISKVLIAALAIIREIIGHVSYSLLIGLLITHMLGILLSVWSEMFKFRIYKLKRLKS